MNVNQLRFVTNTTKETTAGLVQTVQALGFDIQEHEVSTRHSVALASGCQDARWDLQCTSVFFQQLRFVTTTARAEVLALQQRNPSCVEGGIPCCSLQGCRAAAAGQPLTEKL